MFKDDDILDYMIVNDEFEEDEDEFEDDEDDEDEDGFEDDEIDNLDDEERKRCCS